MVLSVEWDRQNALDYLEAKNNSDGNFVLVLSAMFPNMNKSGLLDLCWSLVTIYRKRIFGNRQ